MNANELVESKWMTAEEFGLGEVPREPRVTIRDVKKQKVNGENWGVLVFAEEWAKPLKVNATHKRALVLMFGQETDVWRGKRIDLYAKVGSYPSGKTVAARIKGSPDITSVMSFSVKKFGGGDDVYNLVPTGAPKVATPYEQMWKAFKNSGSTDEAAFKALIKSSTGKGSMKSLEPADVERFIEALADKVNVATGEMTPEDKAAALAAEKAMAS